MSKLIDLYNKKEGDEVFEIQDYNGINIISDYPEGIINRKIFIRLFSDGINNALKGNINLVQIDSSEGLPSKYIIVTPKVGKRWYTNFWFGEEEGYHFDTEKDLIRSSDGQSLTIDDFVQKLINNHIRDRFIINRIFVNIKICFLDFIFLLVGEKLEKNPIKIQLNRKNDQLDTNAKVDQEPFYKYFEIPKNLIGFSLIILAIVLSLFAKYYIEEFNAMPNILFGLYAIVLLFLLEKFAKYIRLTIQGFYHGDSNWITSLYKTHQGEELKFKLD